MMKRLTVLLCGLLVLSAYSGKHELSNPYISLKVNETGGRIEGFYFNPSGVQLTMEEGLLGDNFWDIPEAHFYLTERPYLAVKNRDSVILSGHHTGGGINYMRVDKTIRLPEDEARVIVDYRLNNLDAAMSALEYGYWMQNFAGIPGRNCTFYFPLRKGIFTNSNSDKDGQVWHLNPSRGWTGFADGEGNGMAMVMDFGLLQQFYNWREQGQATLEWYFNKIKIGQGKSLDTSFEFIPFKGLKKISGAGGGLVGEMSINPEKAAFGTKSWLNRKIQLRIYSGVKQDISVKITARIIPNGRVYDVGSGEMSFDKPGKTGDLQVKYSFPSAASCYDVEARAYNTAGELLAIFNVPAEIDSLMGYNILPEKEVAGETAAPIDLSKLDHSLETPHIKWAKPLVNGKIRVLALTPFPSMRELAELAQRVDIELTTMVWMLPSRPLFAYGPYYGVLTETDVLDNLDRLLEKDYDVILLAGINWQTLTKTQRDEIVRRVKNGCGFVEILCENEDEQLREISAFGKAKSDNAGKPRRVREGFLGAAVPYQLFPRALYANYETAAGSIVYAENPQKGAWVAERLVGKGHSVGLGWSPITGEGIYVNGVLPDLPYPLKGAPFRDYFELYLMLTGKAVIAAAGRTPDIHFENIRTEIAEGGMSFQLDLTGHPGQSLKLTAFVRNRDNEELCRKEFGLESGKVFRGFLDVQPWGGQQLLGLILRDEQGNVIDFGGAAVTNNPEVRLLSVEADKESYKENETAEFTVKVSKKSGELAWTLLDAYDRVLSRGKTAAEENYTIKAAIENTLKMRSCRFRVELLLNGLVADRMETEITVRPAPEKLVWDDYEPGIWITPKTHGIHAWLHPLLADKLREMNIQTIVGNTLKEQRHFAVQYNFNPSMLAGIGTSAVRIPAEYQKSGNKMQLVRDPCLSNPEFYEKVCRKFRKLGEECSSWDPRFYWLGDEPSLTGYWSTPVDFCFSPTCMVHFREFLLRKYGSLQALNKQWNRNFSDIQEAVPETAAEARERKDGNYSAWADHLEYMDSLLVEHIKRVQKALRESVPEAKTFISGLQSASAYGGNDWARQTSVYTGIMSYENGGFADLMRSFAPEGINLPWTGYASLGGTVCYELWRSLISNCRGTMLFHVPSMINPDYTLSPMGKANAEYLAEITGGIGKFVITALSEAVKPEILLVYSQASIRAAFINGRAAEHEKLRWKYIMLCRNYGIPYRFVSDVQIEQGLLGEIKPRAVVFPDTEALSDVALSRIDEYLGNGGLALVEGEFAIMDSCCRKVSAERYLKHEAAIVRRDELSAGYYDAWMKGINQRDSKERSMLNHEREKFGAFIEQAGIVPLCSLVTADGEAFLDAEIDVKRDHQGNPFVLVISKEEVATEVRPVFNHNGYVCNIRKSAAGLCNSNPLFYGLLPEEEKGDLEFKVDGDGRDFNLHVDAGISRDTVFRLTVFDMEERGIILYNANLTGMKGKSEHRIKFALNDRPGSWKLVIRELVSGRESTAEIIVK